MNRMYVQHVIAHRVVLAMLLLTASISIATSSAGAADFSADLVLNGKDAKSVTGKIYVQGDKIRQEIVEGEDKQIMLFRPDKGLIWIVSPQEEMYMEMPYQTDNKRFEKWSAERESNAKLLGEETVSGFSCKKYEIDENGEKIQYWVSDKISLPLKVQYKDGGMEYKNIKQGQIPDDMFEAPPEYNKVVMPMSPDSSGESE